jgi:uncharacterized protein DUF4105
MRFTTTGIAIAAAVVLSVPVVAQTFDGAPPAAGESTPLVSELIRRADRQALHEDPQWLALLHYDPEWLSPHLHSSAITPTFFLSADGNRDPRAELHATLRAFFDPNAVVRDNEHPQCAFVARRHWLVQRLGLHGNELPRVECPDYDQWRQGFDAAGLTLIFPEGFMNNPASIFGHTLLRVDSRGEDGGQDVLGWAVDFTAKSGNEFLILYMAKGVFGFYPGLFGIRPYYEQLKRYADWENRNIWEYRLNVDRGGLDLLLMHLWELRAVEFPYYFFTKNCSYELLSLLEIAIDDLDARARFSGYVIPVDAVRVIADQPGLVKDVRYRPSPEASLRARLHSLTSSERDHVQAIVDGRLPPDAAVLQAMPRSRQASILDTAYDQLRYQYLGGQVTEDASRGLSRQILVARARVGTFEPGEESDAVEVEVPRVRPDQGHDSALLSVSAGWRNGDWQNGDDFVDLRLRPAFHSLMDAGGGFPEQMQIGLLDTQLRIYPEPGRVRLQRLVLFEASSLSPRSRVFEPWAWTVSTGLQTRPAPARGGFDEISVWGNELGVGLAWDPLRSVLVYGLPDVRFDVGPGLKDTVSLGPGAQCGLFVGEAEGRWRGHWFAAVTRFAVGDTTTWARTGIEARFTTSRNTAIVLEGSGNRMYGEDWIEGVVHLQLHF